MRLRKAIIMRYRSVEYLEIEMGPLTILFGQNNVGKTNMLEAIYGILAPNTMPGYPAAENLASGVRGGDTLVTSLPVGAVYADLKSGLLFDDEALTLARREGQWPPYGRWLLAGDADIDADFDDEGFEVFEFKPLPPRQVSFVSDSVKSGLCVADPQPVFADVVNENLIYDKFDLGPIEQFVAHCCVDEPRSHPLFLDWEFADLSNKVTLEILENVHWLEEVHAQGDPANSTADDRRWRVKPGTRKVIDIVAALASVLLPDFLGGMIRARLVVPTMWGEAPRVFVTYEEQGPGQHGHPVSDIGRGAARWIAASTQIAMHLIKNSYADIGDLLEGDKRSFSGHVLFIDEPEAHLHHLAVDSIVRWCQRMVKSGFNIVVASHHEAFLRASGDEVRFIKVSRDFKFRTQARTLLSTATPLLQELATEVGMHPATVLSLYRAILFVEGPLDKAVLDEYATPQLDAAGVLIIPIHGTKNLEGLIDGEFTTRLGVKAGVLTDNTITTTMWNRSGKKRTGEEKKLVKLIKRFEDQGLPRPDLFGVPEDDLLFALPVEAIRQYLKSPFPGWHELRDECRAAEGLGPSDSPDWKSYAENRYGLPITTSDGVRAVVHALDLAGVELPSIRVVVDEIINWAKEPHAPD
ncbi:ATP-dependent nuclease [Mycolicibacterium sp. XJ879]